jgi:hypothetical protein
VHERARERQALAIAAREVTGQLPLAPGQVGQPDHALDAPGALGAGDHVDARVEAEVLVDGEVVVEREALGHVADRRLHPLGIAAQVDAEDFPLPLRRLQDPAQHAQRGGLAGAVGPEEPVQLALAHAEVEVIDGDHLAEPLGEPARQDGVPLGVRHGALSRGAPRRRRADPA